MNIYEGSVTDIKLNGRRKF